MKRSEERTIRGEPSSQELGEALAVLANAEADDRDADAACVTLFRLLPVPAPARPGQRPFPTRVIEAVRRAPLPAGRRALLGPGARAAGSGIAAAVVAAAAYLGLVLWPPLAIDLLVGSVSLLVDGSLWMIALLDRWLDLWMVLSNGSRIIAVAMASTEAATALLFIMLIGMLAITALTQVLAAEEESSRW